MIHESTLPQTPNPTPHTRSAELTAEAHTPHPTPHTPHPKPQTPNPTPHEKLFAANSK
ncbi:hypothetical protein MYAER_1532 [Microcystis aeruginosa NIES-2549]|uniref:Uncharacterized protein n=1 Tax=Microcystis aeruginosa NIES-2549 TaxID=1641812 RepID=A0A0F6U3I9_MICAE|nr:hypothetical protein MYAER_1532 [Microcystis aeruginosa NIES-2549]AOC52273.1 hypothetical protein amyaer_1546 [Microcystis aeruginosa NIES-2481]